MVVESEWRAAARVRQSLTDMRKHLYTQTDIDR